MKKNEVKKITGAEELKKLRLSRETLKTLTKVVGGSVCSHSPQCPPYTELCGTTYDTT